MVYIYFLQSWRSYNYFIRGFLLVLFKILPIHTSPIFHQKIKEKPWRGRLPYLFERGRCNWYIYTSYSHGDLTIILYADLKSYPYIHLQFYSGEPDITTIFAPTNENFIFFIEQKHSDANYFIFKFCIFPLILFVQNRVGIK